MLLTYYPKGRRNGERQGSAATRHVPTQEYGPLRLSIDACLAVSRLLVVSMCDRFVSAEVACNHYVHDGRKDAYLAGPVAES